MTADELKMLEEHLAVQNRGCLNCARYEKRQDSIPFFYCHLPEFTATVRVENMREDYCQYFMEKKNE